MFDASETNLHDIPSEDSGGEDASQSADFLEALREKETVLPIPDVGQRLHAKLVTIGEETSFLDYGGRSEALMETRHLRDAEGEIQARAGDTLEAYVIANEESVVLAPALVPTHDEGLATLREAQRTGVPVAGKVTGVNAGGLEVDLAGHRAFCPVSQVDAVYCPDASVFVGQVHDFKILEFGDAGKRIVLSRRALLLQQREEAAARLRERLSPGIEMDGTVARLEAFGAFVDLGGVDGMVHVSEISHDRVSHPSEALKIGEKVRVRILEIGKDPKGRDRIALSIKAALQDPWHSLPAEIRSGAQLAGRVVRLADFGAFVRLLPGVEGLVHVSEIRNERTSHPREALAEGQEVQVRILSVEADKRRISLSMREETPAGPSGPQVGATQEGLIRAHKPYGVFIDLPSLGARVSGLLPLEETGVARGGDLSKRFPAGEKLEVTIQQIDEKGRIRLAIPRAKGAAKGSAQPSGPGRGVPNAMAEALRRAMEGK